MNYHTNTCYNCGGDKGLHHYEDSRCPKNGIEESNIYSIQQWQNTFFEDSGIRKLHDAAPDLLEALIAISTNKHLNLGDLIYAVREREGESWQGESVKAWSDAVKKVEAAIQKAV